VEVVDNDLNDDCVEEVRDDAAVLMRIEACVMLAIVSLVVILLVIGMLLLVVPLLGDMLLVLAPSLTSASSRFQLALSKGTLEELCRVTAGIVPLI
jgi:hypothetical protein